MKDFFSTIPNTFVPPAGIESYKAELDNKIRAKLNALSETAWEDIMKETRKIDTKEEYFRVQTFCR